MQMEATRSRGAVVSPAEEARISAIKKIEKTFQDCLDANPAEEPRRAEPLIYALEIFITHIQEFDTKTNTFLRRLNDQDAKLHRLQNSVDSVRSELANVQRRLRELEQRPPGSWSESASTRSWHGAATSTWSRLDRG